MVATKIIWLSCLHHPVVKSKAAREHSGVGSLDVFEGDTSILKTLVYDFQQFTLLGVHIRGFDVVDAEKAVFELTQIFVNKVAAVLLRVRRSALPFGVVYNISKE